MFWLYDKVKLRRVSFLRILYLSDVQGSEHVGYSRISCIVGKCPCLGLWLAALLPLNSLLALYTQLSG